MPFISSIEAKNAYEIYFFLASQDEINGIFDS